MRNYTDYFYRHTASKLHREPITVPRSGSNKRLMNLWKDIFSAQARTAFSDSSESHTLIDDPNRFVSVDEINANFFDRYYLYPSIHVEGEIEADEIPDIESLIEHICAENGTAKSEENSGEGSNRFFFLTGPIGDGKSTFIYNLLYLLQLRPKSMVIPIYISIEKDWVISDKDGDSKPKKFDHLFLLDLYDRLKERALSTGLPEEVIRHTYEIVDEEHRLTSLVKLLRRLGYKIVLFIDDLDRFHFYRDKFCLFEAKDQYSTTEEFRSLFRYFGRPDIHKGLSNLGITVFYSLRDYVFSVLDNNEGLSDFHDSYTRISIGEKHYKEVVAGRFDQFIDVLNDLERDSDFWHLLEDTALQMKYIINKLVEKGRSKPNAFNQGEIMANIFELSHHGCRSLIDFIGALRIFSGENPETLVDRFLTEKQLGLLVLYILNHRKLYSQSENHFPNLFLVDAAITANADKLRNFDGAGQPHWHSYWLKYFILQFIYQAGDSNVSSQQVINFFCTNHGYQEAIVKQCIGSLATPNWFSCIAFDYESSQTDILLKNVYCKNRGKFLLEDFLVDKQGRVEAAAIPFCFSFTYLQLMVDDYQLYFPNCSSIARPRHGYGYFYYKRGEYGDGLIDIVRRHIDNVVEFLAVLAVSLKYEFVRSPRLKTALDNHGIYIPDFELVIDIVALELNMILGNEYEERFGDLAKPIREKFFRLYNSKEWQRYFADVYDPLDPVLVFKGVQMVDVKSQDEGSAGQGGVTMNFGDNARLTNVPIAVGESIRQTVEAASASKSDDIRQEVESLMVCVADLIQKITEDEDKIDVAALLQAFAEQAVQDQPSRKLLDVTGQGLIEAAKAVADLVDPIANSVTKVLEIIGS